MKSDFENFTEKRQKRFNVFWTEEYPKLNRDEKVKYWLASTHKGMRTQGEAFNDEYSEFSKGWYEHATSVEPDRADLQSVPTTVSNKRASKFRCSFYIYKKA